MEATRLLRRWLRSFIRVCLFVIGWVGGCGWLSAQDILLANFEQTNYAWLPGGVWTANGNCFGGGPAQGSLPNQQAVTGYLGNGLVNTYLNGDGTTGTLTSPEFLIQRNYLRFLIGGGNHPGQTCLNLMVGGRVVRSAVGLGDRENLDWLQWNVSALTGQMAQLQIVDSYTGGWGHINVDQITETDQSLAGVFLASQRYLNLPVQFSASNHLVELITNGIVAREFDINLAAGGASPDYNVFVDLAPFQSQEVQVRIDSLLATTNQLTQFVQASNIMSAAPIYQESLRPIYHYSARRGWVNDANGMVYANGQYHYCYQHNPYGTAWGNMHWGNAVSGDLVHWAELPEALYPDDLGTEFSGSTIVDWNNSAGFGTNALVAFFCAAGGGNRMSTGQPFTQGLAYSSDYGQTWTKYPNNPVIPNIEGDNRDPKVIWYAPGNKWVIALYLNNNDFGFFSSTDLRQWTQTSTFTFPGLSECPELFPLPLDGNTNDLVWIFWAGGGSYYGGQFDGNMFTPQWGPLRLNGGNNFYAAQTFNNIPAADGRRILMAWANGNNYPNMPFNNSMTFPISLTLQSTAGAPKLFANPVNELANLRISTNTWPSQALTNGVNVLSGVSREAYELDTQFAPGTATNVSLSVAGTTLVYDNLGQQITCAGLSQPLAPSNGMVNLQLLVDRGMLEIYANHGLVYMPMSVTPVSGPQPVELVATGQGAQLLSLSLYNLGSAWPAMPPYIATQPGPTITTNAGRSATFTVTATGTSVPFAYQWFCNGQPLAGATNNALTVLPFEPTNANYIVVITNIAGAVTSNVAKLTVNEPSALAYWRMEAQIVAPNNEGVPTWPGIADTDTNSGQGNYTTGTLPATIDDLITFNGLTGGPVTLATNVAPAAMFVNGHNAGNFSYNAAAITNVDGCLFFPQDQYGDELDFTGAFSLELFFKTDGNRSSAGPMQLLSQGTDTGQTFRYGIDLNVAGPGGLRLAVANSVLVQTNYASLTGTNYADGQWHYLLAVCDPAGGGAGQLRLTIANQDGTQANATNQLPASFLPLPATDNGNLFLGRNTYPVSVNPETFLGFIDEVQITAGVVPDTGRIGRVPASDNHPQIGGISAASTGVRFQWTGAAANDFKVQWTSRLGAGWQTIATLSAGSALNSFVDTNAARQTNVTGFYRVLSE